MSRPDAQTRWHGIWARRGAWACLLWPLSQIYAALSALRRGLFSLGWLQVETLPVPVIVVGNVVVGGAGKTPTVIALLQHLRNQGWRPGVVSRGHGRRGDGTLEVLENTPATHSGDEPALIRRAAGVPVFVARRRADAGRALLRAHPEVDILVCDDGLQHLALARDLAIVVFDDRGTGNGWLLPAGLLREPWPARHRFRPQLVLRQRLAQAGTAAPLVVPPGLPVFEAQRRLAEHALGPQGQTLALDSLLGRPVKAAAGIARPEVFFQMLRERGLQLHETLALPDHADASAYAPLLAPDNGVWLCTEKDAVKLATRGNAVWAVPLELTPEPGFFDAVDRLLAKRRPGRLSSKHGHQTA